jgi:Ca-activated chloride channel homolog
MDHRYTQFDPRMLADMSMEKVMKLFMQLVSQSGGDVQQALDWLQRLWERYNFFDGEYGIDDFKKYLERSGNVAEARTGQLKLTEKGERRIRQDAFEEIFSHLRSDALGNHGSNKAGFGGDRLPETRDFEFGDSTGDIDFSRSIHNSVVRTGRTEIDLSEDDLEIYEREHLTSSATVIAIDISHSMTLYGEDRITPAKKVAMALIELITTRYPKDSLEVVLFGDDAFLVPHKQVPYISNGPITRTRKRASTSPPGCSCASASSINRSSWSPTANPQPFTRPGAYTRTPPGTSTPKSSARRSTARCIAAVRVSSLRRS